MKATGHVPARLGGKGQSAVTASLPRRGIARCAGAAADAPEREHAPRLAINRDREIGRTETVRHPALAIDHHHVKDNGGCAWRRL